MSNRPEFAAVCISRTMNALKAAGEDHDFDFLRLRDMSDAARRTMAESQLDAIFVLSNPEKHTYRCAYCDTASDKKF